MRIMHVTDAYLPKQGGIEVQVKGLAERQLAAGHQVRVLTCAPGSSADGSGGSSISVRRLRSPWGRVRRTNAVLHGEYETFRPDAVHVHLSVLSPLAILAVRSASRAGVPVVATLHSLWWWATPLYWIADKLVGWSAWRVQWTAVSELAAEPMRRIVAPAAEVTVVPNGVEPAEWAVTPLPRDPSEVVVASVMRLANRKRPKALLRVVRRAVDRLPEGIRLRVVVVGEGPLRERLEREIERLHLEDVVELAGRMDHDGIRELYRRADVYLAPAILESFGIAALEARCAGLPIVARRQTGIADFVINGRHGLLARTDAGLADALVELACSPSLRAGISEHNRACAPDTGWADVLDRVELAYKTADTLIA